MKAYYIFLFSFTASFYQLYAQIDRVGILYLDESNTENIDFKLTGILNAKLGGDIAIHSEGYSKGTLLTKYKDLVSAGADVIIGPSGSQDFLTIDNYIHHSNIDHAPYFIGPTISAEASTFNALNFINTTATNNQKVDLLYKKLISQYAIDEMGLMYESDTWGLNIVEEFDAIEKIQVTGRPFPKYVRGQETYPPIARFIEILFSKDIRLVVIASWDDKMLSEFLDALDFFNESLSISSYKPIIVLYNNYDLEPINKKLLEDYEIYSVTELSESFIDKDITDEVANTVDATELCAAILNNTNNLDDFIQSYRAFHEGDGHNIDLNNVKFYTKNYTALSQRSNENTLNLLKVTTNSNEVTKVVFDSFGEIRVLKFFKTKVIPLFKFHVFPRNPFVLLAFLTMTFVSFTLFMHNEFYTPFELLLKSKSFWAWYMIYAFITTSFITGLLFSGFIRSNQLQIIIVAGIVCPIILNYIFKQLTNFRLPIPFLNNSVQSFLNTLKHSIDVAFHNTFPQGNFESLIKHIDERSTFSKIRMKVYNLILDMKSNALTKRFGEDLKALMKQIDDTLEEQNIIDEVEQEKLRKRHLIKFYIEILFFTSMSRNVFKIKLLNSDLVDRSYTEGLLTEA